MKRDSQKSKAISKATELYDLYLTESEYEDLCFQITNNQAVFLDRQSRRVSRWLVKFEKEWYPAVYDKLRKSIITFLKFNEMKVDARRLISYMDDRIISVSKIRAGEILSSPFFNRHVQAVISISDPGIDAPNGYYELKNASKLRLLFHDIEHPDKRYTPPAKKHVQQIVDFGEKVLPKLKDNKIILVHCQAGVCRSTAAALTLRTMMLGRGKEKLAIKQLKDENWSAQPNMRMVRYADHILNRNGNLRKPTSDLIRKYMSFEDYEYWVPDNYVYAG